MRALIWASMLLVISAAAATAQQAATARPNIIIILADDLGYGDLSCYNPDSRIKTPNLDALATQGMRFTDAHSPSGVCTPTRYGLLTGRYAWRTRLKSGVLYGYSSPLIAPGRVTLARVLKEAGYRSACIGKWHLGMDLPTGDGQPIRAGENGVPENADWRGIIRNGPTSVGFDYFFGCSASWDMPPYTWIENDRFTHPNPVPTEQSDRFGRPGVKTPGIKPEDALTTLTAKAVEFIQGSKTQTDAPPFFLYFPLTAPHAPVAPNPVYQGASQAGRYGDFVVEVDHVVGQIMTTLDTVGLTTNTLVIFTSDNGPENPMEKRKVEYQHFSASHFLGHKRDNWEGGHRVPFIARWPGKVPAKTISDEPICLTDIIATTAAIVGQQLQPNAAEDSFNLAPLLTGAKLTRPVREAIVHHSSNGEFAIRQGPWKLLLHPGSGGNDYRARPEYASYFERPVQLYNLSSDPTEATNVMAYHPEVVSNLTALMKRYVDQGRSTPGPPQANDTPDTWKQLSWMLGAPTKPNVLFIAVDDLNHWVGYLGRNAQTLTPNIDRLARRGVWFTRSYCAAPVCNPSRTALMSGLRPGATGIYDNQENFRPVIPEALTLTTQFRQAGYYVCGAGKIYHNTVHRPGEWDDYFARSNRASEDSPETLKAGKLIITPLNCRDEDMPDYQFVDYAIAQLNRRHDKPFFIACGLTKPHLPWSVPTKYYDKFPLDSIQLPPCRVDDLNDLPPVALQMARGPANDHEAILEAGGTNTWKQAIRAYLASIHFCDAQVGRLLEAYDRSPERDNTIICFWSDHGWHLGEKHHWRKFALWEETTRAPLIWVVPGLTKADSRCDRTVDFMSIYPTLMDLCGLPRPAHVQGESIRTLLENPQAPWDKPAVTTYRRNNHSIRSEAWRYTRYSDGGEELYDETKDPYEWANLAKDGVEHETVKEQLSKHLPSENKPPARNPNASRKNRQGIDE